MTRSKRLPQKTTAPAPAPVRSLRPNPVAWQAALKIAKGDASRVEVVSPNEMLVHNNP